MDRVWRINKGQIDEKGARAAATAVAKSYEGVTVEFDREAGDCLSLFFKVPSEGAEVELELSIYELGGEGAVLSLEPDAGENNLHWDEASQLAEDIAEELQGEPLYL